MQFIHIFDLKSNKLTFTFILLDDGNIDSQPYILCRHIRRAGTRQSKHDSHICTILYPMLITAMCRYILVLTFFNTKRRNIQAA